MRQNHNLTPETVQAHFNRFYPDNAKGIKILPTSAYRIRSAILDVIRTDCFFSSGYACGINQSCKTCHVYKNRLDNFQLEDMD